MDGTNITFFLLNLPFKGYIIFIQCAGIVNCRTWGEIINNYEGNLIIL